MSFECVEQPNCDPDLCQQKRKEKKTTPHLKKACSPRQPEQYNDTIFFSWAYLDLDFFFLSIWHFVNHMGRRTLDIRTGRRKMWKSKRQEIKHHISYCVRARSGQFEVIAAS